MCQPPPWRFTTEVSEGMQMSKWQGWKEAITFAHEADVHLACRQEISELEL